MKFKTEFIPWINEIKSYINGDTNKIGELKKVLRSVDFSKLDYATKAKLTNLFDPRCEITEEVFKRELNLYFSLLESKNPITIPIFSEYVEWIYSQDMSKMPDKTFEIITSRLAKSSATDLPKSIVDFMTKLPNEYSKNIDTISNARLGTLISILHDTKNKYSDMPKECQEFIQNMFKACAVKTEISDKNKTKFRGLFKEDPRAYYSLFNKAFAGVSAYDTWIDEPAKKIAYDRMIDYANFQEKAIEYKGHGFSYLTFESCAKQLNLPLFPEFESRLDYGNKFYLKEPREYKDYAKKMGDMFVEMVQDEVANFGENIYGNKVSDDIFYKFAPTNKMKSDIDRDVSGRHFSSKEELLRAYSDYLVELVHLDELTGQSSRDIFKNPKQNEESSISVQEPKISEPADIEQEVNSINDKNKKERSDKFEELVSDEDLEEYAEYLNLKAKMAEMSIEDRIKNNWCTPEDLPELYEKVEELNCQGKRDLELENTIFDLESRLIESRQDDAYFEEENAKIKE